MEIQETTQSVLKPFTFTGNTEEYFRIWIVNICLTIVTLGIYSAWAKVRNKRYFYGNTCLDNSAFDYLANPVQIFKGRLLVAGVFVIYVGLSTLYPPIELLLLIIFMIGLPWLIVKALSFNANNSAYRNLRFNFKATYGEAARVFIVVPLAILLTLGLAYPYFVFRRHQFIIQNTYYGTKAFVFKIQAERFYTIYLKAFGLLILGGIGTSLLISVLMNALEPLVVDMMQHPQEAEPNTIIWFSFFSIIPFLLIYLAIFAYIKANVTNLVLSHTYSGEHRLESDLQTGALLWLYLSNSIGIILSLGLLIPWAKIRMLRYRLEHITLHMAGSLDDFVAAEQDKISATGEELSDFFDLDIGL